MRLTQPHFGNLVPQPCKACDRLAHAKASLKGTDPPLVLGLALLPLTLLGVLLVDGALHTLTCLALSMGI